MPNVRPIPTRQYNLTMPNLSSADLQLVQTRLERVKRALDNLRALLRNGVHSRYMRHQSAASLPTKRFDTHPSGVQQTAEGRLTGQQPGRCSYRTP